MPSDTTMNVNLSRDLYQFVKAAVKSGRYTSASEVVRDALREKKEADLHEVQRKIEQGLNSAQHGEVFEGEFVIQEIRNLSVKQRGKKRARE